jgi:hypothetical protein
LAREFLKKQNAQDKSSAALPEMIKPDVLKYAVIFEHRCKEGSRVMAIFKGYQIKAMGHK